MALLPLVLMLSEARAQQTFLYATPAVPGDFGNRSVANAICASYSGLSCSYTTALVFYAGETIEEFPLPINEPVFVGTSQVAASWVDIAAVPFATYFPPFWSGQYDEGIGNLNCLDWQSAAPCSKGIVGRSSLHWYAASCATPRVILCACNGGTFGPTQSPTSSIPTGAPSRTPSKAPTPPTHAPSKAPSRTPTTSVPTLAPVWSPTTGGQRIYSQQIVQLSNQNAGFYGGIAGIKTACQAAFGTSSPSGRTRKAVPYIQLSANNYCVDVGSLYGITTGSAIVRNSARQALASNLYQICDGTASCNGGLGISGSNGYAWGIQIPGFFASASTTCQFWTSSSVAGIGYALGQNKICINGQSDLNAECSLSLAYLCLVEVLEVNGVVEWVQ